MDSTQSIVASSGALQNITSYLNGTLVNISAAFQGSSEYISGALGIPPGLVYSGLAALVAVPITMSRYGWSLNREQSSPYSSMSGIPAVTDEDFSYITSQDLDDVGLGYPDSRHHSRRSHAVSEPEDDILLVKHKGITYPAHFPAYAIGDGKLYVKDVRDRVGILMDLSIRTTRRIKLLYKGRQLKEPASPVRDYGVKNKSELMAVIPDVDDDSSPSGEEMVIVGDSAREDSKSRRRKKKKTSSKKRSDKGDGDSISSPRDSSSTFDPPKSPTSPGAASGPLKRLGELSDEFTAKWLPMCADYIASPPSDPKKRDEEHRKISETIMQQIILKLDEIETGGIIEVRTRRKELVKRVQDTLKRLDVAKAS